MQDQNKESFEYVIIRLVPRVEREEFFNIGVLLFSKRKKFLGIKYHVCPKKLKVFSSEIDFNFINEVLESWELICKGDKNAGKIGEMELADRFRWLASTKSTIIQTSKTHSGICVNPSQELKDIFKDSVL